MPELIDRLRDHCRTRPGALDRFDLFNTCIVLGGFQNEFVKLLPDRSPPIARLRLRDSDRTALSVPDIRESDILPGDTPGWMWADLPLDGSVPEAKLIQLIDRSYQLVVDGLSDDDKYEIGLFGRSLTARVLLAELIDHYGFKHKRKQIEAFVERALLLRTSKTDESILPIGQSKIGGRPDLPPGIVWPMLSTGKPLVFLAQINLAESAEVETFADLPRIGLLSVFSAYGWQEDGDDGTWLPVQTSPDWTRILYQPTANGLRRQESPTGVKTFPAAPVKFVPILSLPEDEGEPVLATLCASDDDQSRFSKIHCTFNSVTMSPLGHPPKHQLLGYPFYEQGIEPMVVKQKLRMVFQLESDDNIAMLWGDGGRLYFWMKPDDLKKCNFSRVISGFQCS